MEIYKKIYLILSARLIQSSTPSSCALTFSSNPNPRIVSNNICKQTTLSPNTLNLTELGYDKILSKGELKTKLKIVVKETSKSALEKIKKIGGEVVAS